MDKSIKSIVKDRYPINGQLIRLKHYQTERYLTSNNIKLQEKKSFITGFQDTEKTLVGCGSPDLFSLWQIIRVTPPSKQEQYMNHDQNEILFDDPIMIRNYSNAEYLTIDTNTKAQVTDQAQIYCQQENLKNERQFFMIQRFNDPYKQDQVLDERIHSKSIVTLISFDKHFSLHSHDLKYKQKNAKELQEVTGFSIRDENDHWEIIMVDRNNFFSESQILQRSSFEKSTSRINQLILSSDSVIIRNAKYGWTLHSHKNTYQKDSNYQEVTCRKEGLRDDNDWWKIIKVQDDQVDQYEQKVDINIKFIQRVKLFHNNTLTFLVSLVRNKVSSGNGLQVSCYIQQDLDEFRLIALNRKQRENIENLTLEYPFLIHHVQTNTYLTCHHTPSKPTQSQFEVALESDITHAAIWQIEQKASIIY